MFRMLKIWSAALLRWVTIALAVALALPLALGLFFRLSALSREKKGDFDALAKRGHLVQVQDTRLFYQELGSHQASLVVVFVPGTGAWSEIWKPTMDALAKQGIRSLAVDLPPFGLSEAPRSADYSRRAQGERLSHLLHELNLERVVLVGHSFGGQATLTAALANPSKLAGLVLVDIALGHPVDLGGETRPLPVLFQRALEVDFVRSTLASVALHPWLTRRLLGAFVLNFDSLTGPVVTAYQEPMSIDGASARTGDWLQEFLVRGDREFIEKPKVLQGITVPTEVIWGTEDRVTPLWQGRWLKHALPKATLTEMKGVGHIPQIEDAPQFQRVLSNYLKTIK